MIREEQHVAGLNVAAISRTPGSLRLAELVYEPSGPSPLGKNTGSGFEPPYRGRRSGAALRRGSAPARRPILDGHSDISKWHKR